ncbi:hypothetical protein [Clostridium paridis]|uniref:Uncharacterized protein n=1 Tax=Clostridium paridis TaxID=2803863 RepID=A0A937FBC7_9CLOT|nr:hypothetical protein [Clostridium paridis]MBL4930950.1 hypothetical protein [Clostridium paridis]
MKYILCISCYTIIYKGGVFILKRNAFKILTVILLITLVIGAIKYKKLSDDHTWQQTYTNGQFIEDLKLASGLFAGNYTTDKSKNFNYYEAISKLECASQLFVFTPYSRSNPGLIVTIGSLCDIWKNDENKEYIIQQSKLLSDYLYKLSINPDDKDTMNELNKLENTLGPKK